MPGERQALMYYDDETVARRFISWYCKVIRNEIRNGLKKLITEKQHFQMIDIEELEDIPSYEQSMTAEGEIVVIGSTPVMISDTRLASGLKHLSPRKRKVLESSIILRLPIRIIAQEMRISEQTVKNYRYDSLRFLRIWLEEEQDG